MDESSYNEFFNQFPATPSVHRTHTANDLRELLNGLRQEITALTLMESIWLRELENAEKEVSELESQWLMEVPNGTKNG
jgi:hypothetical protein